MPLGKPAMVDFFIRDIAQLRSFLDHLRMKKFLDAIIRKTTTSIEYLENKPKNTSIHKQEFLRRIRINIGTDISKKNTLE